MSFQDRELRCRDCGSTFIFTAGEQEFYASKGLENDPQRCPTCRAARRATRGSGGGGGGREREMFPAVCARCGKQTQVPFQPTQGRPVYCSDCYALQSSQRY